jgi:hypothetical protein
MSTSDDCDHPGWQRHLAPSGGPVPLIGWTRELHGPVGRLAHGFTPTVHELRVLARYWAGRIAEAEAAMATGTYDPSLARVERFAHERLREYAAVLGWAEVQDALAMARAIEGKWEPGGRK